MTIRDDALPSGGGRGLRERSTRTLAAALTPEPEALRDALLDLIAPPMGADIVVDGWRSGMRARLDAIIAAARAGYRR